MNTCILTGRLVKNASVKTSKELKVMSFVVETINSFNGNEKRDQVSCVMFNPEPELENQLTKAGEGLYVEFEGRVSSSSLKANGERRYNTDVIARNRTFNVVNQQGEA
jgi:single-stranded DNA-binding protein